MFVRITGLIVSGSQYFVVGCVLQQQLNSGTVVAVGPGTRTASGGTIPVSVKEGDTVLLPEYGDTQVKLGDKE